jgi:hypothetical protein
LEGLNGTGVGKWVLDLTDTALFHQLAAWGQKFNQVEVHCDESKPLEGKSKLFNVMIQRTDKKYVEAFGESHPITFNMSKEIQIVDSKDFPGIQIADLIAAATSYFLTGNRDTYADEWSEYLGPRIMKQSILPDFEHVNLDDLKVKRNALILEELVDRSRRKISLLDGMPEYMTAATQFLLNLPKDENGISV